MYFLMNVFFNLSLVKRFHSLMLPAALIIVFLLLSACNNNKYKVSGIVEEAPENSVISLEKADANGRWFTLDSVKLSSSGKFSFSQPAVADPEILRLSLNNQYIYIPIDSIEHITVKTRAPRFSYDFSLEGSPTAEKLAKFEKELIAFSPKVSHPDSLRNFKLRIFSEYLKDAGGSILSYYILTKTIDGIPLYNNEEDYVYFAAVATSFRQFRPNDPRTALLESVSIEGMKKHNSSLGRQKTVEAPETAIVEITLPDTNGSPLSLSQVVGKGRKTVVFFSNTQNEETARLNLSLRSLKESKGFDIFQVSFDPDTHAWRMAAVNLPWYSVWAGDPVASRKVITDYNISSLPVFFIYDEAGQLKERAANIDELKSKL